MAHGKSSCNCIKDNQEEARGLLPDARRSWSCPAYQVHAQTEAAVSWLGVTLANAPPCSCKGQRPSSHTIRTSKNPNEHQTTLLPHLLPGIPLAIRSWGLLCYSRVPLLFFLYPQGLSLLSISRAPWRFWTAADPSRYTCHTWGYTHHPREA